jgi:hypothetical protein
LGGARVAPLETDSAEVVRADVSGTWGMYIAVAVIVTALLTAAAVAGGCYMYMKKMKRN